MKRMFSAVLLAFSLSLASWGAQAAIVNLVGVLSPDNEVPLATAPGAMGTAAMMLDTVSGEFGWMISFTGLTGNATAAHFYKAAAGVNGPPVLNLDTDPGVAISGIGQSEGLFVGGKTLSADNVTDILAGLWYVNIHTSAFPGGEIRAQVGPGFFTPVPVPAAMGLFLPALALLGFLGRRRPLSA